MGNLPTSRTENCIPGAPVSHNLMNEIQDNIVGENHGTKTISVPINGPRTGAAPGFTGDFFTISGASPQAAVFQISGIPVGRRMTAVRVRVKDSATGPTTMQVTIYPSTDGAQGASLGSSAVSSGSGAAQTLPVTGINTIVAGLVTYSVYVQTTAGAANTTVCAIDVDYDNLP